MRAPPSSRAAAKPTAWAAVVIVAARFAAPWPLNSTIAAVDGPAVRPTPMPMKARPRKQPEHIGRQREQQGAKERSADTPQDCGATADIIGHIAEADQNGGYDNGIDGEDPGRNRVGEMPLLGKQRIGHRRRSAGPQGVRDHAGRNPEACALPKLVRRGVSPGAAAVRPASGWRQKGTVDHRFTPGAPGVPTSEVR